MTNYERVQKLNYIDLAWFTVSVLFVFFPIATLLFIFQSDGLGFLSMTGLFMVLYYVVGLLFMVPNQIPTTRFKRWFAVSLLAPFALLLPVYRDFALLPTLFSVGTYIVLVIFFVYAEKNRSFLISTID